MIPPTNEGSKRLIWIAGAVLLIVMALLLLLSGPVLVVLLGGLTLTACARGFLGRAAGWLTGTASLIALVSAQMHWMGGHTVCLADPEHPYLWSMQRSAAATTSGSYEDDGETISISFSSKSEDLVPGARFAAITIGADAEITPLFFTEDDVPAYGDTVISDEPALPDPLAGAALFAPRDAEFRATIGFDDNPVGQSFSVADLPVLVQIDEETYTPVGVLTGTIELGETAQPEPAAFQGRNMLLDDEKRRINSEARRAYFRDKTGQAGAVVDQSYRDWVLMQPISELARNRYAEAFDCRPEAYEAIGIGWIFGPGADWFS
ncbi:MAG: hypothetical protein AAGJ28_10690 [Pseudomonadota bacterium]